MASAYLRYLSRPTRRPGIINNERHDFGSILRFIEHNFGIQEGALNFADSRATNELTGFYDGDLRRVHSRQSKRRKTPSFFLHDKRKATDFDDDDDDH